MGVADNPGGDGTEEVIRDAGIVRGDDDHVDAGLVGEFQDLHSRAAFAQEDLRGSGEPVLGRERVDAGRCVLQRLGVNARGESRLNEARHLFENVEQYQLAAVPLGQVTRQTEGGGTGLGLRHVDGNEDGSDHGHRRGPRRSA